MFHNISEDVGPVLMTNHFENEQIWRLYEKKSDCQKVAGPQTFSNIGIDWDRACKHAKYFKRTRLLTKILPKILAHYKYSIRIFGMKLYRRLRSFISKIMRLGKKYGKG
jgi:hypothetical protein